MTRSLLKRTDNGAGPLGSEVISRVLITGGSGFTGSHLVQAFSEAGIKSRILDPFTFKDNSIYGSNVIFLTSRKISR